MWVRELHTLDLGLTNKIFMRKPYSLVPVCRRHSTTEPIGSKPCGGGSPETQKPGFYRKTRIVTNVTFVKLMATPGSGQDDSVQSETCKPGIHQVASQG